MKKIIIAFSIIFGGFYMYSVEGANQSKIVFSKYAVDLPGDSTKNVAKGSDTTGRTQAVLDSINNSQYSGVYYGNLGNTDNQDQHVPGTREPNSYKSGRTGGQYDVVVKPGSVPMKKKTDYCESK